MPRMARNDIRAELVRRGVSIVQIARESKVSDSLVHLVLNGQRRNRVVMKTVARHLGKSSEEIFGTDSPSEEAS